MKQIELLEYLAKVILEVQKDSPILAGIDGIDASGKTTLAKKLVSHLQKSDCPIIYSSVDHFHNPESIRYKKGRNSPEGYYLDSFNLKSIKEFLLEPLSSGNLRYKTATFDYRTDSGINSPIQTATKDSILIMDGIFLFRLELANYWDIKIFLDIDFKTSVERAVNRSSEKVHLGAEQIIREKFDKRYIPGQKIYFEEVNPREKADIVIDNNDFENPVIRKTK